MNLVSKIAVQILVSLEYFHSLRIIHCDLTPENILLKSSKNCGIKVIDFGSGCYETDRVYTYIQSRFYRAPEVMLGIPYTTAIDMWSFACIIVELYIGYPLFPGENESEQFLRIMEVLGVPSVTLLGISTRKSAFFDGLNNPKIVTDSKGRMRFPGTRPLDDILGCEDFLFIEFLSCKFLFWKRRGKLNQFLP